MRSWRRGGQKGPSDFRKPRHYHSRFKEPVQREDVITSLPLVITTRQARPSRIHTNSRKRRNSAKVMPVTSPYPKAVNRKRLPAF